MLGGAYGSHYTNLIIGTIFVCLVVVPLIIYATIQGTKQLSPEWRFALRFFVIVAAIFGIVSSVVLIGTILEW